MNFSISDGSFGLFGALIVFGAAMIALAVVIMVVRGIMNRDEPGEPRREDSGDDFLI